MSLPAEASTTSPQSKGNTANSQLAPSISASPPHTLVPTHVTKPDQLLHFVIQKEEPEFTVNFSDDDNDSTETNAPSIIAPEPVSTPSPRPPPPSSPPHRTPNSKSTPVPTSTRDGDEGTEGAIPDTHPSADKTWNIPEDIHTSYDVIRHIRLVSKDPTLSDVEKNRRRQLIHSCRYGKRQKVQREEFQKQVDKTTSKPSYSSHIDPETKLPLLGCEHYARNCKLRAKCCNMWIVCRRCHDHAFMDHAMNRFDTVEIRCMLCDVAQPVADRCINCGTRFARYFCAKCKFYDNEPGKDIYHCDRCKICRVGKGIGHDNFHCDTCDACVSLKFSTHHKCLNKSLDANCPICGLYLFTSTRPVVFMKCGHTMHAHCFDDYTDKHYTCPLCHKSLTNMQAYYDRIDSAVSTQTMPSEFRQKRVEILCHDCDRRCDTQYHYFYNKCVHCQSYNTRVIRTFNVVTDSLPASSADHPTAANSSLNGQQQYEVRQSQSHEVQTQADGDAGTAGSTQPPTGVRITPDQLGDRGLDEIQPSTSNSKRPPKHRQQVNIVDSQEHNNQQDTVGTKPPVSSSSRPATSIHGEEHVKDDEASKLKDDTGKYMKSSKSESNSKDAKSDDDQS